MARLFFSATIIRPFGCKGAPGNYDAPIDHHLFRDDKFERIACFCGLGRYCFLNAQSNMDTNSQVLETIEDLHVASADGKVSVQAVASWFADKHGEGNDRKVTAKWIGRIIRRKLGLKTERSRDGYVIAVAEKSKLERLYEKYGIEAEETAMKEADADQPLLQTW